MMRERSTARRFKAGYDYVVIGSGSAGSVVAARLAEAGASVLLVEAGPSDQHIYIRMPAALGMPLMNDRFNWSYCSEPEPHLGERRITEARGRVLGGSSSINGMNWVRGNPWDYDHWAELGMRGWSYAECLPYFRRAEKFGGGGDRYRGGSGPMRVETCRADGALYRAFLAAGVEAGHAYVEDHNAYRQEGVHITQRNVDGGIRWSTSQAYIHAQPPRPNLDVATHALVTRIVFDGKRADRIAIAHAGADHIVEIGKEAIVCAGAINAPQLLLLSGIGDADALNDLDIPLVAHLPGVGQGLKDHVAAPVQYRATQNVSAARELSRLGRYRLALLWILTKRGLGATNFFEVGAFLRTDDGIKVPNVQVEFVPLLGELQHGSVALENGFQYFLSLMRPTSTGRVWIDSRDPRAAPKFVFNYLATEADRQQAIAAVKAIRAMIAQRAWDGYRGAEVTPGADVEDDDAMLAFLRKQAGTNYHPCCTCRMGHDDMAVVDESARVHGLDNLRVIDASILPEIVSGNLNAPVIMMAEKLADAILGRPPLPPDNAPYYRA
jgi:choline dehydrogenase